jgi:hypothetical protein
VEYRILIQGAHLTEHMEERIGEFLRVFGGQWAESSFLWRAD